LEVAAGRVWALSMSVSGWRRRRWELKRAASWAVAATENRGGESGETVVSVTACWAVLVCRVLQRKVVARGERDHRRC
jgi:hypothetical protein